MVQEEEEEKRREKAIEETKPLQPDFNFKGRFTQHQLSKLQELHKRRLQIKSKFRKKLKDGNSKSHGKHLKSNKYSAAENEGSGQCDLKNNSKETQNEVEAHHSPKKRQKLHWGLDTKERWERKANM